MAQKAVEIILMRQLAGYLAMPIMVFDPEGDLLFYNEPMEAIIGQRFDETGEMTLDEWCTLFELTDDDGSPLPREERALVIALEEQQAAHRAMWVRKKPDGVRRKLEVTAFPLEGQSGRHLGAVVFAWEAHDG